MLSRQKKAAPIEFPQSLIDYILAEFDLYSEDALRQIEEARAAGELKRSKVIGLMYSTSRPIDLFSYVSQRLIEWHWEEGKGFTHLSVPAYHLDPLWSLDTYFGYYLGYRIDIQIPNDKG